ncbi:MAG TPA: cupin domain-containing protein [Actinomycetota bacterium]|nr:cupin domain-containing protein [Actinomycetota bacterium]
MHTIRARVLGPEDGEVAGAPEFRRDRFMVDGADTGSRLSVVEHTLGPRVLAGPLHFHTREDEFSFVLEGRLGALLGDQEVVAGPRDLVFKPRGQWHTFWNAGEETTRILELITPAGLEDLFRELGALGDDFDPATLPAMAEAYGCQVDFEGTAAVIERRGLWF